MGQTENGRARRAAGAGTATLAQRPDPELAPDSAEPQPAPSRNRPTHVERIGNIRVGIWANDGGQAGVFFTVTPSRIYKDSNDRWQSTDRFGRDDLLTLAKVLDRAHSWICDTQQHMGPSAATAKAAKEVPA